MLLVFFCLRLSLQIFLLLLKTFIQLQSMSLMPPLNGIYVGHSLGAYESIFSSVHHTMIN